QGFDIDGKVCIPACGISPVFLGANKNPRSQVALYGRLGVHCFNIDKERKLQYMRIPKYNVQYPKAMSFHITVEVNDLADNSAQTLQTLVTRSFSRNGEDLRVSTGICRIKPKTPEGEICLVDEEAIDKFYRGVMPNFVSKLGADDDKLRFYEVQEQDICANEWLRLYTEFALFSYWRYNEDGFESCLPVEIKKIIVETCDTHREPRMKLKLIPSDADFIKFTIKYDMILVATMISLWMMFLGEKPEFFDFDNFELSKVTFRGTMGILGIMMAGANWCGPNNCIIFALFDAALYGYKTIGFKRIGKELAMIYGFLALAFLLMYLFGFFFGVLWLLVSPPSLLLGFQFLKRRNVKESQD
ncbi:Protein MS5, partial [Arabidopsis thaliana x Arabidopsis arenosa]